MAYDPADAADKKIVDKLIADALEAQSTEHETEITGLKNKNKELIGKLKEADKVDPAKIAELEFEIETNKKALVKAEKQLEQTHAKLSEANDKLTNETGFTQSLLIDNGLSGELAKANVAPQFLDAVKALLKPQVSVKIEGDNRKAVVGDKDLGAYIAEWSQGDSGKHYVAASNNSGGNSNGGTKPVNPNAKTITRTAFDAMPTVEHSAFFASGGTITDG